MVFPSVRTVRRRSGSRAAKPGHQSRVFQVKDLAPQLKRLSLVGLGIFADGRSSWRTSRLAMGPPPLGPPQAHCQGGPQQISSTREIREARGTAGGQCRSLKHRCGVVGSERGDRMMAVMNATRSPSVSGRPSPHARSTGRANHRDSTDAWSHDVIAAAASERLSSRECAFARLESVSLI